MTEQQEVGPGDAGSMSHDAEENNSSIDDFFRTASDRRGSAANFFDGIGESESEGDPFLEPVLQNHNEVTSFFDSGDENVVQPLVDNPPVAAEPVPSSSSSSSTATSTSTQFGLAGDVPTEQHNEVTSFFDSVDENVVQPLVDNPPVAAEPVPSSSSSSSTATSTSTQFGLAGDVPTEQHNEVTSFFDSVDENVVQPLVDNPPVAAEPVPSSSSSFISNGPHILTESDGSMKILPSLTMPPSVSAIPEAAVSPPSPVGSVNEAASGYYSNPTSSANATTTTSSSSAFARPGIVSPPTLRPNMRVFVPGTVPAPTSQVASTPATAQNVVVPPKIVHPVVHSVPSVPAVVPAVPGASTSESNTAVTQQQEQQEQQARSPPQTKTPTMASVLPPKLPTVPSLVPSSSPTPMVFFPSSIPVTPPGLSAFESLRYDTRSERTASGVSDVSSSTEQQFQLQQQQQQQQPVHQEYYENAAPAPQQHQTTPGEVSFSSTTLLRYPEVSDPAQLALTRAFPIFSFAFPGKGIMMLPREKEIGSSAFSPYSSPTSGDYSHHHREAFSTEFEATEVSYFDLSSTPSSSSPSWNQGGLNSYLRLLKSFPGPLTSSSSKNSVLRYLTSKTHKGKQIGAAAAAAGTSNQGGQSQQSRLPLGLQHTSSRESLLSSHSGGGSGMEPSDRIPANQLSGVWAETNPSSSLLWDFLYIYVTYGSELGLLAPSSSGPDGGGMIAEDSPLFLIKALLLDSDSSTNETHQTTILQPPPDPAAISDVFESIQSLILEGKRKEACKMAVENGLWDHALLIGSFIDSALYRNIIVEFANSTFPRGAPMRTLYLLMAGKGNDLFAPPVWASHEEKESERESFLHRWRENLAVIISSPKFCERSAIVELGDRLESLKGDTCGAHVCYLLSSLPFSEYSSSSLIADRDHDCRMILVGGSHHHRRGSGDIAFINPESIRRTEVVEYARMLGNSQYTFPEFQVYKFVLVSLLIEVGLVSIAQKYLDSIFKTVKNTLKSYRYPIFFLTELETMQARLKMYGTGNASTLRDQPVTKRMLSGILGAFDKGMGKLLGGSTAGEAGQMAMVPGSCEVHVQSPQISTGGGDSSYNYTSQSQSQYSQNEACLSISPQQSQQSSSSSSSPFSPTSLVSALRRGGGGGGGGDRKNKSQQFHADEDENDHTFPPIRVSQSVPVSPAHSDDEYEDDGGSSSRSRKKMASPNAPRAVAWLGSLFSRSKPNSVQANMGLQSTFRYDSTLGKWVDSNAKEGDSSGSSGFAMPPTDSQLGVAPNNAGGSGGGRSHRRTKSEADSPIAGENSNESSTGASAFPSPPTASASQLPSSMQQMPPTSSTNTASLMMMAPPPVNNRMSMPPMPVVTSSGGNKYSIMSRANPYASASSRYVDTFNKPSTAGSSSTAPGNPPTPTPTLLSTNLGGPPLGVTPSGGILSPSMVAARALSPSNFQLFTPGGSTALSSSSVTATATIVVPPSFELYEGSGGGGGMTSPTGVMFASPTPTPAPVLPSTTEMSTPQPSTREGMLGSGVGE